MHMGEIAPNVGIVYFDSSSVKTFIRLKLGYNSAGRGPNTCNPFY